MIDHSLDRGAGLSFGEQTVDVDEAADVIRVVLDCYRRDFPKFPLWKRERMKLSFTTIEPLFKTGALIDWPGPAVAREWSLTCGVFDLLSFLRLRLASEQTFDLLVGDGI